LYFYFIDTTSNTVSYVGGNQLKTTRHRNLENNLVGCLKLSLSAFEKF